MMTIFSHNLIIYLILYHYLISILEMNSNLLFAGPCGVGKSTISKKIADLLLMYYVDFDLLGLVDMEKRKGNVSPFSLSGLNFSKSIAPLIDHQHRQFCYRYGRRKYFSPKGRQRRTIKPDTEFKKIL